MLRYTVRQFFFEGLGRYYLPLPKMTAKQLLLLIGHLERNGFGVVRVQDGLVRARAGGQRLTVDGAGLAWSNVDLLDVLAPCIPDLLRTEPRDKTSSNPFFLTKRRGEVHHIQFFPRLETRRTWKELRRTGSSCLTPDEYRVLRMLLENARGSRVDAVTDFPVDGSRPIRVGRKSYFRSQLGTEEFAETLDTWGGATTRRSFLPISSHLVLRRFIPPTEQQLRDVFEELGEWCFVTL